MTGESGNLHWAIRYWIGRGWGAGAWARRILYFVTDVYCHNSYVPCAIRGATFAIDVENGLETKVQMITVANRWGGVFISISWLSSVFGPFWLDTKAKTQKRGMMKRFRNHVWSGGSCSGLQQSLIEIRIDSASFNAHGRPPVKGENQFCLDWARSTSACGVVPAVARSTRPGRVAVQDGLGVYTMEIQLKKFDVMFGLVTLAVCASFLSSSTLSSQSSITNRCLLALDSVDSMFLINAMWIQFAFLINS